MINFIGNAFTSATIAWAIAYAFQFAGLETAWAVFGVTALLFSALAFGSTIVGGIAWTVRHVRITVI